MPYSTGLILAKDRTERTEIVTGSVDQADADSPDYRSLAYLEMIEDVEMMREVAGGTKSMRAARDKYLPQHPMETKGKYDDRVGIAVAFNALKKTVAGLVGMVFRREPVEDEVDERTSEEFKNVDLRGRSLAVFMRGVGEGSMRDGHAWIHVEAPRDTGSVRTRADERMEGVRPYWIHVSKAQAINWRFEIRGGKPVLTLFAYTESGNEPVGAFGEESRQRIRVLREVRGMAGEVAVSQIQGELWEYEEKTDERDARWVLIEGPYVIDADEVPVVFVPADPASPEVRQFMSDPPLRDLAYEQIEHYRVRSDRQKSMTFASVAVPYVFGEEATDQEGSATVRWSSDGMLLLNDPNAKAGMLESHGYGLDATKAELTEIEGRMAALGLQMLVGRASPQPTTATEKILDKTESDAALVLFAQVLETAANEAHRLHAKYRRAEPQGTITLNRDFHEQLIDAQRLQVLSDMVSEEKLSLTTLWLNMVEGEVLPEDFDPDEERRRIADEAAGRLEATLGVMFNEADGSSDEQEEDDDEPVAA